MERPVYLKSGDPARLFPALSESNKEQRATSILLSVLSAVPPFANILLSQIGQKIGSRTVVNTYTEIVFKSDPGNEIKYRPDGLVEVVSRNNRWTALIESKIGTNRLDVNQVESYLKLARENGIDAVITISNDFATLPTHPPLKVSKANLKKVSLFHFSWTSVLTEAVLMHENEEIGGDEQAFLIREFVRFFSHPSAGINGYTSMPEEWNTAIERIQAGGKIPKSNVATAVVSAWHQEVRDLVLQMSRRIGVGVELRLPRSHVSDPEKRLKYSIDELCETGALNDSLIIPNTASDITLVADLRARCIRISMKMEAPKDKQSSKARLNWLLRQLKDIEEQGIQIGLSWVARSGSSYFSLSELRERPEVAYEGKPDHEIRSFEITTMSKSARRFNGRKTFIEDIETMVPRFYEFLGQHLRAWNPSPPKPVHSVAKDKAVEKSIPVGIAGNAHGEMLEIPQFLNRTTSTS
jgi:hypothetical protein